MSRKKRRSRDAPAARRDDTDNKNIAIWIQSDDAKNLLCPSGYTPLDRVPAVRQCTHIIADLVSSMTLQLMENGDKGDFRVWDDLSYTLDIAPSKTMPRKNFYYRITSDMVLYGNSVGFPSYGRSSRLEEIQLLPASSVSFERSEFGYSARIGGKLYPSDTILHFPFIPDDIYPFRGVGLSMDIADAVQTLVQANTTKKGFMSEKWKPSLIISVPSDSEKLQTREGRKAVLGSYIDDTQAGEPWVIPAGQIDVKTLRPLTLNDLAVQSSIELDLKTIASAFGIPAFMLGLGTFNKDEYNNFISSRIMGIASIIQQVLTQGLVENPRQYLEFKSRSLMQYDLPALTSFIDTATKGGWMSRNEGRAEIGLPPIEGLDEIILLENYIPISKIGEQKKLNGGD